MAIIGIVIGIFVFLFTGAFVSEVLHVGNAGIFPGLVAAIWAARPFVHQAHIQRQNLLHPVPREYTVSAKVAFSKIRDLLADTTYNFGDRWHVATADTQAGRISASLRFTDEHTHLEVDARGHIHSRKERVQRFLGVSIVISGISTQSSMVQLDFSPKVEGVHFAACDSIIVALVNDIEMAIGPSTVTTIPKSDVPYGTPSWLTAMTIMALLSVCADFFRAVMR